MVINVIQTYRGDHSAVYTNIKQLCCTLEDVLCQLHLNKSLEVRELGMLSLHFRTVGKRWTLDYLVYDTMG